MRKLLLMASLSVMIISCDETRTADSNVQTINIEDLSLGPIVHESLTEDQLSKIKLIQETLHEVYSVSLDETITNFKRDQNPDNEINIWLNMVDAYQPFAQNNSGPKKLEARKEAFKLILLRSMMPAGKAITNSELKILTDDEIQEILSNYSLDAKPIKIE